MAELDLLGKAMLQQALPPESQQVKWWVLPVRFCFKVWQLSAASPLLWMQGQASASIQSHLTGSAEVQRQASRECEHFTLRTDPHVQSGEPDGVS